MAAVSELRKRAAPVRGIGVGVLCWGMTVVIVSCSQPAAKGYYYLPGACSVVQEPSIVKQLGPEAVDFPNTAKVEYMDTLRSGKCEWESFHPPNWGSPANAQISVIIRVRVTEDGDPDVLEAEDRYRGSTRPGEVPDSPPNVIGDVSRHSFEPGVVGPTSGSQVATVDFRRANAHVTVEYRGWGDRDFTDYYIPRGAHEAAARDMARQVAASLGEPM